VLTKCKEIRSQIDCTWDIALSYDLKPDEPIQQKKYVKDIVKKIKTGDILLYRETKGYDAMVRVLTNSNYSRVAVLIRKDYRDDSIYVIETSIESGIIIICFFFFSFR
jgi:S-adenosylmethionine:tRNA-ribosyltransferase-isomerase (queuine synthetase)